MNNGAKLVRGELQFVILSAPFLDTPPTADEPAATIAKVVRPCIIPGIPKDTPLDSMIKERYLTGVVSTWDNTAARKALIDLEPRGSANGQRLLKKRPTVSTRGMSYSYSEANKTYTDAHMAGTLTDADYVEWIVLVRDSLQTAINIYRHPKIYHQQVRNHQQHHADGKLDEAEYNHACRALNAFVDSATCLTDVQREKLRGEIRKICG